MLLLPIITWGQERYALLIGIGQYPVESGWTSIHGDNDVSIILPWLVRQGFKEEKVSTIKNTDATKAGIMSALEELKNSVKKGDVVYIHFSGHGQQVTDLDGDEVDRYDEAWIPYDARKRYEAGVYEGENHLLDDELNFYLNGLRSLVGPRGKIVVVADACHSGSGSRGAPDDDDDFIRGTNEKFEIPGGRSNVVKKEPTLYWLYVGACKPYQTNHEYRTAGGSYYGCLSYTIVNSNQDLVTSNYREVINHWKVALVESTRYPQDLDEEGQPSKKSNTMF